VILVQRNSQVLGVVLILLLLVQQLFGEIQIDMYIWISLLDSVSDFEEAQWAIWARIRLCSVHWAAEEQLFSWINCGRGWAFSFRGIFTNTRRVSTDLSHPGITFDLGNKGNNHH